MISKKRMAVIAALRPLLPLEIRHKVYQYLQYPGAYKRHWKKMYSICIRSIKWMGLHRRHRAQNRDRQFTPSHLSHRAVTIPALKRITESIYNARGGSFV